MGKLGKRIKKAAKNMGNKVYLITTNEKKLLTARKVLSKYSIDLEILNLDYEIPEIQSYKVSDIAGFSAEYAANKENKHVLVTDVGYYIKSLKGFPGPFVKQMNHYLTSEDLLKMMQSKEDRSFIMYN